MIVHDFVTIGRPLDEVTEAFAHLTEPALSTLAQSAWEMNRDLWHTVSLPVPPSTSDGPPTVKLGAMRERDDATVMPHTWRSDEAHPCYPLLDADLELAQLGTECTQLHLIGHYRLPGFVDQTTLESNPVHRATIVAIRTYLHLLADLLDTGKMPEVTASSVHRH